MPREASSPMAAQTQIGSGRRMAVGLGYSIGLNAALPLLVYYLLTGDGWSQSSALIGSSVPPVVGEVISLSRTRALDGLGVVSLIFPAIGIAASLFTGSPRFLLAKESVVTGVSGAAFAVSMTLPRPLAFYFGRQFATGGDSELIATWNAYWQYPAFRRVQYTITAVWAVAFIGDALVRLLLVFVLPVDVMVWLSQTLLYVVIAGVMLWMFPYIRRTRSRASAQAPQP